MTRVDRRSGDASASGLSRRSRFSFPEAGREPAPVEQLLGDAPHAIAITEGPAHLLRWVNAAFCRFMGVAREDLLGHAYRDALPEAFGEGPLALLARVFSSAEAERDEELTCAPEGSEPSASSYTAWPLREPSGAVYGLLVEVRDRTREVESKRLLEEMAGQMRQINERLLRSAVREQEWAQELEGARSELEQAYHELEQRVARRTADLERSNKALTAEIAERERSEQARTDLLRQLITAEEMERRRISLELHDQMGQQVTGLLLGLKALAREPTISPGHMARIQELERLTDQIARDIQHMAVELRPPALDNLGLPLALQVHLEDWSEQHGIEVDFHCVGMDRVHLPRELETSLYRITQEGLTNALKHAGATRVSLVLESRRGLVTAILEDDGEGFHVDETLASPEKARRLGLRGMRERVALLNGELEIESSPGGGTTLFVRVPVPDPAPHRGRGARR